jgi:hypothetical protein
MPLHRTARVTRTLALAALLCAPASLMARPAQAGVDTDLRAGYYVDAEAFGLGAGLISGMGSSGHWFFNPNLELAFGDHAHLFSVNGDVHYDFASVGSSSLWIGAGPALLVTDPDQGDSDTRLGLNVFTGITAVRGGTRPFAQLKGILSDNSEVVLQGGIRF